MTTKYEMHNDNNLVIPASNKVELGNGLKISEQRGKKDMMWGQCISGEFKGKTILYPVYAADDIVGNFSGETESTRYHIVKSEDIVMSRVLITKTIDK